MLAKYFNEWEFKQAMNFLETDPNYSKILYENYLQKYPKDYSAYPFYSSNLILLGELDLAEKVLTYVENKCMYDKSFINTEKNLKTRESILFTKIKLLCYQGKYEELYRLCMDNLSEITKKGMNGALFYAKKQIGRLNVEQRDENSYLFRQIVRYEENDFLRHITKHLSEYNENADEPNACVFAENFPIKKVLDEIKKYIPSDKKLLLGFFDNIYYFKYNNCGRVNNKVVNYFKVVCLKDTQEFITMCPSVGSESLPYVDLNYLVNNDIYNEKVKQKSQIDKFYQKYKI